MQKIAKKRIYYPRRIYISIIPRKAMYSSILLKHKKYGASIHENGLKISYRYERKERKKRERERERAKCLAS